MADEEPDYLDQRYAELQAQYDRQWVPKKESAEARRERIDQTVAQIAVQATATVIGGIILAAGAVALGWLGSNPDIYARVIGGVVAFAFMGVLLLMALRKPLGTAADAELFQEMRRVRAMIEDRDIRRAAQKQVSPQNGDSGLEDQSGS